MKYVPFAWKCFITNIWFWGIGWQLLNRKILDNHYIVPGFKFRIWKRHSFALTIPAAPQSLVWTVLEPDSASYSWQAGFFSVTDHMNPIGFSIPH
jgi:hypothetical protein